MGSVPVAGAMVALVASEDEIKETLKPYGDRVSLAAVNGPLSVVVSGDEQCVDELHRSWRERGREAHRLNVSHAFHSKLMEPMLDEFREVAESLDLKEGLSLPIVSNVTGELLMAKQAASPDYWAMHVRAPVRFLEGVRFLEKAGVRSFLEVGPDSTLSALALQCVDDELAQTCLCIACHDSQKPSVSSFLAFLTRVYNHGIEVDWSQLLGEMPARHVELPTYAFQRERYWLQSRIGTGDPSVFGLEAIEHPILGAAVELPDDRGFVITGSLSSVRCPWLRDHAVAGTMLLPGTAFLEFSLTAARMVGSEVVQELILEEPLVLREQGTVQLQVTVSGLDVEGVRTISIYSRLVREAEGGTRGLWVRHASGALGPGDPDRSEPDDRSVGNDLVLFAHESWPPSGSEPLDTEYLYDRLMEAGYDYGPSFQRLTAAYGADAKIYAEVALDESQAEESADFQVHPVLVDAALHALLLGSVDRRPDAPEIPFSFTGVHAYVRGASALRVCLDTDSGVIKMLAVDRQGAPVLLIERITIRPVDQRTLGTTARRGLGVAVHGPMARASCGAVEKCHANRGVAR